MSGLLTPSIMYVAAAYTVSEYRHVINPGVQRFSESVIGAHLLLLRRITRHVRFFSIELNLFSVIDLRGIHVNAHHCRGYVLIENEVMSEIHTNGVYNGCHVHARHCRGYVPIENEVISEIYTNRVHNGCHVHAHHCRGYELIASDLGIPKQWELRP